MLYGSECWTVTKADALRIDATDQWCLRRILDIRWNDFVRNEEVRRLTEQPPLSSTVKSRRLSLFGHLARMDESADANRVLFEQLPENWRRLPGRPRSTWIRNITDDLSPFDMGCLKQGTQPRIERFGGCLPSMALRTRSRCTLPLLLCWIVHLEYITELVMNIDYVESKSTANSWRSKHYITLNGFANQACH